MSTITTREVDQITSLLPKLIDENTRIICTQVLISVIKLLQETHLDIDEEQINSIIAEKIANLDLEIDESQVRDIVNSAISELNINDYLKKSDATDTYLKKTEIKDWAKATNKPSYNYSEITGTPSLAAVATSGSYNDLSNKPTIPNTSTFATKVELANKADKNGDNSEDFNVNALNLSHNTTLTNTGITKTEYHEDTLAETTVNINFPNESGTLALEENTVDKSEYETVKESYEELVGAITGEQFDVNNSSVNYGEALTNFVSNNTSVTTATNALNDLQEQIASIATLDGDNSGTQLVARINKLVDDKGYVSTATFNDDVVASLQNETVETAVKQAAGYDTSVNGYVQTSSNETNTYEITNTGSEIDLYHKSQVTISGNPTAYKETWCKVTADEIKFYVDLKNNALTEISAQSVVAPKFIKNGGTSEQILLADGSTITIDELIARINNNS